MSNSLLSIFKFLFRARFWLFFTPIITGLIAVFMTSHMRHMYQTSMAIYTGVVSGYDVETTGDRANIATINSTMDNITNVIMAKSTLKEVSMRLYAQDMMYGDPKKDNQYITASNARAIQNHAPAEVRALIDKTSEKKTLENLKNYEKANRENYIYGLFNYTHRHYSFNALSKIQVKRLSNSDIIQISYTSDDPGIAYNTLILLNEEFLNQYEIIRYGQTNDVIKFFEHELDSLGKRLHRAEDSLMYYSVDKKVINYGEQTKYIASLTRDYALVYEAVAREYNGSSKLITLLDSRVDDNIKSLVNNSNYVDKMKQITDLSAKIAAIEPFSDSSVVKSDPVLIKYKEQLARAENEFNEITTQLVASQATKEGISTDAVVTEWLNALVKNKKSEAELKVIEGRIKDLDKDFEFYAPVGTTLSRKEREIGFLENSYLSILNSLNAARLRQKNLKMTSASLNLITPPTFPISSLPTKRSMICLMAAVGSFIFILVFFILLEILDRTLRDRVRAERITGAKVVGSFPNTNVFRFRAYIKDWIVISSKFMSNTLLSFFKPGKSNVINVVSTSPKTGKTYVTENLKNYMESIGLKVKKITYDQDFETEGREIHRVNNLKDLVSSKSDVPFSTEDYDVVIVEYKSLNDSFVPYQLLTQGAVNVVIAGADKVWSDTDQMIYERVKENAPDVPIFMYLNKVDKLETESFVGMLPPYNIFRKFSYKIYQLGLTSK
ncbi:MAG: hypothetical protein PHD21_01230 [Flavobacteriales bacterium]|nr:hypothetical protein [Flavobacteriales bacterium]